MNTTDQERALKLATEAGRIMLQNGAEISRVEDTMERISTHYGVSEQSFFVLSNGIIATGQDYAKADYIPIKGMQLSKVIAVNQLSRDVVADRCTLDDLEKRLEAIRNGGNHPWWHNVLSIAIGLPSFCILFKGSMIDVAAMFMIGLLLGLFMTFAGSKMSRVFGNLMGGIVGGQLCIISVGLGFGENLPNMITSAIICLVPGIPFTNGIRDLVSEDYLAGFTRLLDALLVFICIAMGVIIAFLIEKIITGDLIEIGEYVSDSFTSQWYLQLLGALIGTMCFSVLFGVPNKYNLACGIVGTVGWGVYLLTDNAFVSAMAIALISHLYAVYKRCPVTVFLICGLIPLVPGGGIFLTSYYMVSNHLKLAAESGFVALSATVGIAGGIIIVGAIFTRIFQWINKSKMVTN